MSFSYTVDRAMLDYFLATYTTLYAAYSTTTPAKDGTNITEPDGPTTGYARVDVAALLARTDSEIDNDVVIEFPTATGDQGTITHAVLFSAASAGDMRWFSALSAPKAIVTGDTPRFPAGEFNLTMS